MQNNDPNNPSQQPSLAANGDSQAEQPTQAVPSGQLAQPARPIYPVAPMQPAQPGYPYVSQNTQPGYPAVAQHRQPGYAPPVAQVPTTPGVGAPTWYAPVTPVDAQASVVQTSTPQTSVPAKPVRPKARSAALFALTCMLALVFGVGLFSGWTFAHSGTGAKSPVSSSTSPSKTVSTALDSQTAREAAIEKVLPAVVEVVGQVSQGTALGSGVIVDKNGDIITNNHVVDGATGLQVVLSNGRTVAAQLIGTDPANDLAVLRIQPYTGMVVATLGDSSKLTVGQEVLALGNPLGYSGTVTSGVVSALNRNAQETRTVRLSGLIQTSAPINPGNSGGALINLQGEVVGIPTLAAINNETNTPAEGIGFAIPSSQVQATLKQILG